jgi:hypothetical protein
MKLSLLSLATLAGAAAATTLDPIVIKVEENLPVSSGCSVILISPSGF